MTSYFKTKQTRLNLQMATVHWLTATNQDPKLNWTKKLIILCTFRMCGVYSHVAEIAFGKSTATAFITFHKAQIAIVNQFM